MKKKPHPSVAFLKKVPHFTPLIKKHGEPDIKKGTNLFAALVRSIIHQQVSGKAAASILAKFQALFPGKAFPTPEMVLALSEETLRSAGLSGQKTAYIRDLAQKCLDGTVHSRAFAKMSNDEIITHLTAVKGVGVWTAHMFLIFTLGRPDILPVGDLGIQKGFKEVFKLRTLPNATQMERLAKPWRTHASAASWYLWRAADEVAPQGRPTKVAPKTKAKKRL